MMNQFSMPYLLWYTIDQIIPIHTAEMVDGKKPKVRWMVWALAMRELANSTSMKAMPSWPTIQAATRYRLWPKEVQNTWSANSCR